MIRRDRLRTRGLGLRVAVASFGAAVALLAAWVGAEIVAFRSWEATAAAVAAVEPRGDVSVSILPFRYRGRTRFLTVPVSAEESAAAQRLPTGRIFARPAPLRDAYLRVLVRTQSTSHALGGVARQLRVIRDGLRLDGDEYVELIAAAVQEMAYDTPRADFQLPVRALATGRGVCVDRSVLLAALLVHEGYDAGLWTLAADNHVAVAIRGEGEGYRRSGYVFVEATRRAFVGEVPEDYAGLADWEPVPRLVVAGRGAAYRADVETAVIVEERREAERLARRLEPYRGYAAAAVGPWREAYEREARRQLEAASLAAQLSTMVDDRTLAFATLATLGGWRDPTGRL